jgi:hypothetical protein
MIQHVLVLERRVVPTLVKLTAAVLGKATDGRSLRLEADKTQGIPVAMPRLV